MPSTLHEALLLLFRNRTTLAPEILERALAVPVPAYTEARVEDAAFTQVTPTEYHADLVVLLGNGVPVFGIVVEVQLSRDETKRFSWPLYAVALRARLRCPTCLLVVAMDQQVAEWASEPIELGQPSSQFQPVVLGPGMVPVVASEAEARSAPELAVLSAIVHGKEEQGTEVGKAVLVAARDLDEERRLLYIDLVFAFLGEDKRKKLEEQMARQGYEYQSDFARRYFAEGRAEGRAEGKAEGKADGLRAALLKVLGVRGFALSPELTRRIEAETSIERLERWLSSAINAKVASDIFSDA
ncbi:MAG: hypothetical protein HYZ28_06145 [Myxococcales bacterium]|nr:hypothetical protein [Myxococcales bacterium]